MQRCAIKPPVQARSIKTYHRILDAAERLLAGTNFDDLTITEVVREAKTSVGVFYSRFSTKEALLDALYDRHQEQVADAIQSRFDPARWKDTPLPEVIRSHVHTLVELYRGNVGLYRALVLRGHLKADWRYGDEQERNKMSLKQASAFFESRRGEIGHPDPALAGVVALLAVMAALREKILFGHSTASGLEVDLETLEDELAQLYCAYLKV